MKKLGLYGGTFDPVHIGHLEMAQYSLKHLDHLIIMPCHRSPHKLPDTQNASPVEAHHRLNMLHLAFDSLSSVEISSYELKKEGISYAYQTFEWLQQKYPDEKITLIIGWDQALALHTWHRFQQWKNSLSYLFFHRKTDPEDEKRTFPEHLNALSYQMAPEQVTTVSSSEIRRNLANNTPCNSLLPPKVASYIQEHRLYAEKEVDK